MADDTLKELADKLALATRGRNEAQAKLDVARKAEVEAQQAVRNHMKTTYNVDPWRL